MRTTNFRSMFKGTMQVPTGEFTINGDDKFSDAVEIRYSPVHLRDGIQPTSIRTDKAASKSLADEEVFDARLMIHPRNVPVKGAIVTLRTNETLRVMKIFPRYSMDGTLNHFEVDLIIQ